MSGHFAFLRGADLTQADRTGSTITYRPDQTVPQEALMALTDALRVDFRFGVHTPWSLTSDLAWDRTHPLVGRMWVVGGW